MANINLATLVDESRWLALSQSERDLEKCELITLTDALPIIDNAFRALAECAQTFMALAQRELEVNAALDAHIAGLASSIEHHRVNATTSRHALDVMTEKLGFMLEKIMELPETENEVLLKRQAMLVTLATSLIESITTISLRSMH